MVDELRQLLARFTRGEVSADDALRAMLAFPSWRVWVDDDGRLETVDLDDGTTLVIAESAPDEGREFDGRVLVREVAPRFGGVVFDPDEPWGAVFRPEQLPTVARWATIVDLEQAIATPGPGQVETILQGPYWAVVTPGTSEPAVHRVDDVDVVTLLTAPDAVATFETTERFRGLATSPVGREVWEGLARRSDYDGIRLNPLRPLSRVWPPHLPASLVRGLDPRPGATPLPARTVAEIHLWLDQHGARPDKRTHVLRSTAEGLVAVYRAWWDYEPRSIPFEPVEPADPAKPEPDPLDLGAGASRILCAGWLLGMARGALAGLPEDPARANATQQERAARAARLLFELEKLVEGDRVPFRALRTPEGAHLWHREPAAFTADAVRALRRRAEALASS